MREKSFRVSEKNQEGVMSEAKETCFATKREQSAVSYTMKTRNVNFPLKLALSLL